MEKVFIHKIHMNVADKTEMYGCILISAKDRATAAKKFFDLGFNETNPEELVLPIEIVGCYGEGILVTKVQD